MSSSLSIRHDLRLDGQSYRLTPEVDAARLLDDLADAMRADTVVETRVEMVTGTTGLILRPGNAKIVYVTGLDRRPFVGKPGHQ